MSHGNLNEFTGNINKSNSNKNSKFILSSTNKTPKTPRMTKFNNIDFSNKNV